MDLLDKLRALASKLEAHAESDVRPFDTTIEQVLGASEVVISGRRTLMFGSNNYLGLTRHPEVVAAGIDALERFGTATTGSRVANGSYAIHRALEAELGALFGKRHGMIFTTGHQANLSVLAGLCGRDDVILLDAEAHASLFDGAQLSGATTLLFRHNSPADLARKLDRLPHGHTNRLVVVEGLYSITGDVAPLAELSAICKGRGAYLLVDEAHSFGVFGGRGLGAAEASGTLDGVDFLVGTFSKSLAANGGFVVSNHDELQLLHFSARAYLFTASPPPAAVAIARAALSALAGDTSLRERLWRNVRTLRSGLAELGLRIGAHESPVIPIWIDDQQRTVAFWQELLRQGVYTNLVLPPACPAGRSGVRASCSAAHEERQIEEALAVFARVRTT